MSQCSTEMANWSLQWYNILLWGKIQNCNITVWHYYRIIDLCDGELCWQITLLWWENATLFYHNRVLWHRNLAMQWHMEHVFFLTWNMLMSEFSILIAKWIVWLYDIMWLGQEKKHCEITLLHCGDKMDGCDIVIYYCDGTMQYCENIMNFQSGTIQYHNVINQHRDDIIQHCDGTVELFDGTRPHYYTKIQKWWRNTVLTYTVGLTQCSIVMT